MHKSMKSSWIKTSYPLSLGEKDGKWGEEIQQSLTDKAQCTPSQDSLCSDKVGVKKEKKSKTEEAFPEIQQGFEEEVRSVTM